MTSKRTLTIKIGIPSAYTLFIAVLTALIAFAAPATAQNPVPFVDQPLVPDAVTPGDAAFTLTVNGAGFVATSVVNWNGTPRATTFVSNSQLTAAILASDIATARTASVTVVSPSPGGGVSNTQFFSITVARASVLFQPVATYDSGGEGANAVAVADLNGDGHLDMVVANASGVGVRLGNGDGTFQAAVSYSLPAENTANAVAIADLNGDGYPDLAIASRYSASVFVLLGNGDGTFKAPVEYNSGGIFGTSVAIADLNGDGHPDLVVTDACQYTSECNFGIVGVLLGKGNGTFYPAVVYRTGGYYATSVAIGDVNGDGKLDLVVTNLCVIYQTECTGFFSGPVSVMLGNGDGTFEGPVGYGSGGEYPVSIAIADLNGDGHPDLAVVNESDQVGVLLGNGDGTFQPPVSYASGGYGATSVAIGDLNGDAKLDLAVSNDFNNSTTYGFGTLGVLLGNGDSTFQSAVSFLTAEYLSNSVAIADLNGDGKPDLLVADYCEGMNGNCPSENTLAGTVGVFLNNSTAATTTSLISSLNPSVYGQKITWTATVTSTGGTPPNGETVTFYNGLNVLGTAPLSEGIASLTKSSLNSGIFTISATYAGDASFTASTSPALQQVVDTKSQFATATALASSLNPALYGQTITWTATVTTSGATTPTGKVNFNWGSNSIGTVTLNASGVATLTRSNLSADLYPLIAVYVGDTNNGPSASPILNQVVQQTTSAATISSSPNPSTVGEVVTFIAKITSPTATPTGPVTFTAGKTVLGTVELSKGKATLTVSTLPVGSTTVTVTYPWNSDISGSSASVTQTVQQ